MFIHKADFEICRNLPLHPGKAVLQSREGERAFVFSLSWSDKQIWRAAVLANQGWRRGFEDGQDDKEEQVLKALGSASARATEQAMLKLQDIYSLRKDSNG